MSAKIKDLVIKTEKVKWSELKDLQPNNLKLPYHIETVKQSLIKNGFSFSFYVWEDGKGDKYIVDGHLRADVLNELINEGYDVPDELSCTFLDLPNRKVAVRYLLEVFNTKKNPIDEATMIDWLQEEEVEGVEVDWLDMNHAEVEPEQMEVKEDDFEAPDTNQISTDIVKGDIYELRKGGQTLHRLMCGDSTSVHDVEKLMNGEKADMVFTDPPYNMDYTGSMHGDGSKGERHEKIQNDKMSNKEFQEFLDAVCQNITINVKGAFYITFYRLGIDWMFEALNRNGIKTRNLIIWKKNNFNLSNSDYKSFYEPMFYGWVVNHNFYGSKGEVDIWEIDKTKINDLHPTMKPIALSERAIKNSSKPKEVVLDMFLGSGSTMVASHQLNRRCYGMELDPKYCQVIIGRMKKLDPELEITKVN